MEYARYEAEMRRNVGEGKTATPQHAHLEKLARQGDAKARAALEGPPLPDAVAYLWDWVMELSGRSGVNMAGLNPLSYSTIADWAQLTGRHPTPLEAEALIALDAILISSGGE